MGWESVDSVNSDKRGGRVLNASVRVVSAAQLVREHARGGGRGLKKVVSADRDGGDDGGKRARSWGKDGTTRGFYTAGQRVICKGWQKGGRRMAFRKNPRVLGTRIDTRHTFLNACHGARPRSRRPCPRPEPACLLPPPRIGRSLAT